MEKTSKKNWAYVALIAVVVIWGLAPILSNSKWIEGKYSPAMLTAVRGLISAIALGLMNVKKLKKIDRSYWKVAVPTGLFMSAGYICQMTSYLYTTPAKSSFLENVSVIVIPIVILVCTKVRPTWTKILACGVCFVGSGIIALKGGADGFWSIGLGDLLAMLSGVFYGVNIAGTGLYSKKLDAALYVFIQLSILAVVAFAYSFIVEGAIQGTMAISFEWQSVLCILTLALVSTALCWSLRTHCFKYIPVVVVSVVMPFSSVITGISSVLIGMDTLTWNLLVGGLVVLAAILLAEVGDALEKQKKEKALSKTDALAEVVVTENKKEN
ncbi:MAG: DMT family transporter [Clostridia bacterium]|nr:DMT family transporter [Clostridia bacterium]